MRRALTVAAAVLAAVASGDASAQRRAGPPSGAGRPVFAEPPPNTDAVKIVDIYFPDRKETRLETSWYDLDGDGQPELLARLKGKAWCDEDGTRCRTVVLKGSAQGWSKVLDRRAADVEVTDIGYGGMRSVRLDGREDFAYNGRVYSFDIARSATATMAFKDAPAQARTLLVSQFGQGASLLAAKDRGVVVKVAQANLRVGEGPVVVVRLEGPGTCGRVLGCPFRVLQVKDKAYVPVAEGLSDAEAVVLPVVRGGWHDIAVRTPSGHAVYGWSGNRYVLSETMNDGVRP